MRVVDLTTGIGGAYCVKVLGDAGAEVVMFEPPDGAPLRRWTCTDLLEPGADSALFRYLHHGHRSIVGDDAELTELLAGADVVVTDRLDAATLFERDPGLIVVAITPWGLTGPYAGRPASELTLQAESGALAIRGRGNLPPFQAGGQITDWVSGVYAAVATLAALRAGHGELIDVSWHEVANLTCTTFSDLFDSLRGRPPLTSIARSIETPSIEPTLDGYVGFNTNTRQQFDDFLRADRTPRARPGRMGRPRTNASPAGTSGTRSSTPGRRSTPPPRSSSAPPCCASRSAPVADAARIAALEQVVQRGVLIDDPTGTFRIPRRPWTIDAEPAPPPRPAPHLGEHSATIEPRRRPDRRAHDGLPLARRARPRPHRLVGRSVGGGRARRARRRRDPRRVGQTSRRACE